MTVPVASLGPGDRSRDSLGGVCIYINGKNTHGPAARRRARTLGLGTAPQSTVDSNVTRGGSGDRSACSRAGLSYTVT